MILEITMVVLVALLIAAIAVLDVHYDKKFELLERKYHGVERELDVLLNNDSQLSVSCVRLGDRIDMLEDSGKELKKKLEDAEAHVAAQVAEKVEKRWDAGLEKMMAWNPYDISNEDGGN
jgi:RNA processing factor Prp31